MGSDRRVKLDFCGFAPTMPAAHAEELGFATFWAAESLHNPFLPLAVAADRTDRIGIGTAIATAFTRSPMITAVAAWDLQAASRGRFVLGLGTQIAMHNERRFSVPHERPASRLREVVLAIRHIWGAFQGRHELDFQGEFYRHDLLTPPFDPGPIEHPEIPIYLAAVTPRMYRLAGEIADGVHVHPFHTARYLREVAGPALGRRVKLVAGVICVVGGAERELVWNEIGFYASNPVYRTVLDLYGLGDLQPRLAGLAESGRFEEHGALVPEELVREVAIVADSWEDAAHAIRERYDGVVDSVWIYPTTAPKSDDDVRRLVAALQ